MSGVKRVQCSVLYYIIVIMPKVIKSAGREIILKVKRACEEERDNNGPIVPFSKVRARVAYLTGVSERTVTQIIQGGNVAVASSSKFVTPGKTKVWNKKKANLDDFDKCAIRHKIQSFYSVKKEIPTINKLWLELRAHINFKYGRTSLKSILKTMGYKYIKCQSKRKVLIERSDIAAWRAKYIMRLRKNRQEENRPVIYLDETYINSYHLQKYWQLEEVPGVSASDSVGARWIIAHAGGKTGFVENGLLLFKSKSKSSDYLDDMNSAKFMRWMKEKIVPNLQSNSIVVMDNASYHCTKTNKAPTMGNTKSVLQEWLTKNDIEIDDCWTKAQLYELIKRHKGDPQYEIEQMLNEHGHEVLFLPPYHCDLNPIENIWEIVKRRIAEKNVDQTTSEIASITEAAFRTVATEEWHNVCLHVEKIEDKYFESDRLQDIEIDKYIINGGDTSDSSNEDSSMDSDEDVRMEGVIPLQDHCYTKFKLLLGIQ